MAEPLQDWVFQRLKITQEMAARTRKVDLPAVGPNTKVGTPHIRARPVEHTHICQHCGKAFTPPDKRNHKYCRDGCYLEFWHARGRSRQAYKRMKDRAERRAALASRQAAMTVAA